MKNLSSSLRSSWLAAVVFAVFAGVIAFGCAGQGGSSGIPNFQQIMRSSSLSGFQSMAAISGYTRRAMRVTNPVAPSILSTENGYDNMLGLYVGDGAINGGTMTFSFFTDQAHTNPAGMMSATIPGGIWNPMYTTFPTTVTSHVDVDDGHHAGSGDMLLTYNNALGESTVTGDLHLDQNDIDLGLDLTVSNDGSQIGGGWTAATQGVTVKMTNLSGSPDGEWSGDVSVQPFGWTGSVTMNPETGAYQANVNTSQGPINIAVDSAMTMTISHGSEHIVITNALGAGLAGSNPGGSGGNTGGLTSTGGATGGLSSTGGSTTGETNGSTNTTGETTGETTGTTNTTGETTSAGSTGSVTTGSTNGSTTAGTTGTTTTTTGETTGSTNGSTSAGTTGSTSTTGETTGSTNGSTSAGTTGSTTTTTGGFTTGSLTTGSNTTGSTSAGTTGSTTTTTGSNTSSTGGTTTGTSGSTGGTTNSTGSTTTTGGSTTGTSGGSTTGSNDSTGGG
jgi:hypothetical protein